MLSVTAEIYNEKQNRRRPVNCMGKGMRSIYMLSLLKTYEEQEEQAGDVIMAEDPEIFLHPKLQKGLRRDTIPSLQEQPGNIFHTLP